MSEPLRIGLVGCGRLGELGYAPALRLARGVRLAAVADPDSARAALVGGDVPRYVDAAGLLSAGGVDALVLATPAHAHLADARVAAERDVPVLIEKPPAPDLAGATALGDLASPAWIGFNRRFDAGVARLRARVPSGGSLSLGIRLEYLRERWRPHAVSDDVLLDLGPHAVDLAHWLSGAEPVAARARRLSPRRASVDVRLGPSTARIELANRRPHRELVEARSAGGGLIARHRTGGAHGVLLAVGSTLASRVRRRSPANTPHPLVASLAAQLEAFARAVGGGARPWPASVADGLAAMQVIDAVRRSAETGGAWSPVEVP